MSSLALMRLLESAPLRYDAGMRVLTLGRVAKLHEAVARAATPVSGCRVLEIGCGTGAVTERLVARGAKVTALDHNPEMLEQARRRLAACADDAIEWLERTASELDTLPEAHFDAAVASLCLSEMSAAERAFVLRAAYERLRPGGLLVVGEEVRSTQAWQRGLHRLVRGPQAIIAWLLVASTSHPVADLDAEIEAAGFRIRDRVSWLLGSLAAVTAERPR